MQYVCARAFFSSLFEAQINCLSSIETANVESALDQLDEIADEFEDLLDDKGARDRLGGDLDALRAAIANLRDLFEGGKIKSVPDLDDGDKRKYQHGNDRGSPSGAYCDDKTFVKNDATGEWEQCTEGDILISDNLLRARIIRCLDLTAEEVINTGVFGYRISMSGALIREQWILRCM